jgi:hypothetical protein
MVSQRKQIANRLNAAKSTGPRTDAGKRVSAQNRLRHGFYSADVVLPGEDRADYDVLLDALVAEHKPQTATQMLCVQRIASCTWKLRRLEASHARAHERQQAVIERAAWLRVREAEQVLAKQGWGIDLQHQPEDRVRQHMHSAAHRATTPAPPDATLAMSVRAPAGGEFERLGRYEQRLQNMIHRALAELRKLREERAAIQELPDSPFARDPAEQDDDTERNQEANVRNEPTADRPDWPPPPAMDPDPTPRQAYMEEFLRNEATGDEVEPVVGQSEARKADG